MRNFHFFATFFFDWNLNAKKNFWRSKLFPPSFFVRDKARLGFTIDIDYKLKGGWSQQVRQKNRQFFRHVIFQNYFYQYSCLIFKYQISIDHWQWLLLMSQLGYKTCQTLIGSTLNPIKLRDNLKWSTSLLREVAKRKGRFSLSLGVLICLDCVLIETLDLNTVKKLVLTVDKILTVSKSMSQKLRSLDWNLDAAKSWFKSLDFKNHDWDKKACLDSQENLDMFQKLISTDQEVSISILIGLNCQDPQA